MSLCREGITLSEIRLKNLRACEIWQWAKVLALCGNVKEGFNSQNVQNYW